MRLLALCLCLASVACDFQEKYRDRYDCNAGFKVFPNADDKTKINSGTCSEFTDPRICALVEGAEKLGLMEKDHGAVVEYLETVILNGVADLAKNMYGRMYPGRNRAHVHEPYFPIHIMFRRTHR
jgi:hypothetical protein